MNDHAGVRGEFQRFFFNLAIFQTSNNLQNTMMTWPYTKYKVVMKIKLAPCVISDIHYIF